MRALVVSGPGALAVTDVTPPAPGPNHVRVAVAAAGVCHSDLAFLNGTVSPPLPLVPGHEASGTVVEVGSEVSKVGVGDRVVLNWSPSCGVCWFCSHREPWLCDGLGGGVTSLGGELADGTPVNVQLGLGAFAEQVVVHERAVVPLPPGVPLDLGALLGCAVLTGVGAVRNTAAVRQGESVLVIGLGGVGLSVVAGARLAGAAPIIAVDVSPAKEPLARALGATEFLVSSDGLAKQVRALTGGRGADHAVECVGRSSTIRAAWGALRRGGTCTVVGMGRRDDPVTFNAMELYHFARTIHVSVYGASDPDRDIPMLADLVRSGELDLAPLVTDRIGLADVPAAFERMEQGVGGRSLVVF